MKYTKSQAEVLDKLPIWFRGDNPFAILEAPGGYGKSFLLKHFLDKMGRRVKPLVMAEYSEAVNVLKEFLGEKYTAKTVCSAFNLVLSADELGIKSLKCHQEPDFEGYNLFIIDEASILSTSRLKLIMQTAIASGIMVLFVGHRSQLPPIEDSDNKLCVSPVFLEESFVKFKLTEPVRHTGELWEFCNESEKLIYKMGMLPNKFVNSFSYLNRFVNSVDGAASFFAGRSIALAYTNERVKELNLLIRKGIFGKEAEDNEVLLNERLIARQPIRVFKDKLTGFEKSFEFILTKKKNTVFGTNTKAVVTAIDFKDLLNITCYELKIKTNHFEKDNEGYIYIPLDFKQLEPLQHKLKNSAMFEKELGMRKKKFNILHELPAVFNTETKYGYAITVHQSQGSTIDTVFVDDNDINRCRNEVMKRKLRYVAYSRSKEQLIRLI
jgi:exodeoxyribonuclease-5